MSQRTRDRRKARQRKQRDRWPDPGRRCAPASRQQAEAQRQDINTDSTTTTRRRHAKR
jgi:hypothetical protein